jgi:hypothetical protein
MITKLDYSVHESDCNMILSVEICKNEKRYNNAFLLRTSQWECMDDRCQQAVIHQLYKTTQEDITAYEKQQEKQ